MKILIADKLDSKVISEMEKLGAKITVNADLDADNIPSELSGIEVLIVRSTKVTEEAIERADSLSLIIRAGAGVNTIALTKAAEKGIHVANCPGKNSDAVAELAIGLLIAADRRISFAHKDISNGAWKKKEYGNAAGLKDRTLGIIGVGTIGKGVIKRAQALEMNIIAWSRSLTPEKAELLGIECCATLKELAQKSDAISIHIAAKPETEHIINSDFLSQMKDGAIIVNAARGEVIDTVALKSAIKEKHLRVALDVFENEPKGGVAEFADIELAKLATCTPHIGASTDQSTESIAQEVLRIVKSYKESGIPINVVNIRKKTTAKCNLVIRHHNKVGVLAEVLDCLKDNDINIEEMQNTIFEGGITSTCVMSLDSPPSNELIKTINQSKNIIHASMN